jgi:methionyl-tRNA synthetase
MSERIFIGVAWPYANSPLHIGQIAGAYLPPDIFARYHRTKGSEVLMVSGSDSHGTPITIRAEQEGITPGEIVKRFHTTFLESWRNLGISFDLFTSTGTENHKKVAQRVFLRLYERGYIYTDTVSQPYCARCDRFLPDRYIEGTCPYCYSTGARGDQCDNCGKPLNAVDLLDYCCRLCGTVPKFRDSKHFFLKLSAFRDKLLNWINNKYFWKSNVLNFTKRYLEEGLKDRAITRDIGWGITLPIDGYQDKRIYVWFEAVIGYLSASIEWASQTNQKGSWQKFWQDEECKSYYFIGKDNIPFHTIIWPAMLMGYGNLNLPYDVPANEYLTIEGVKFSSSRNKAVWLPEYLSRYDPDPLRYYLSINMPETSDSAFSWREFVRRNNDELVATYGNLAQRVLTLIHRNFDGKVPEPTTLDNRAKGLITLCINTLSDVDRFLHECHFRDAVRKNLALAQEANRYLEESSPWKSLKTDQKASATALYVVLCVLSALALGFYPFLPFSSQRLYHFLGFKGDIQSQGWSLKKPKPNTALPQPSPLFRKLDEKIIEEENQRLGG